MILNSAVKSFKTDLAMLNEQPIDGLIYPINRLTDDYRLGIVKTNEEIFYGPRNPYATNTPNDGVSPEPYIQLSLLDSDSKLKYLEKTSRTNPINSVERDSERIQLFLNGVRGSTFLETQKRLQSLNAFNETAEFNSDSILANTTQLTAGTNVYFPRHNTNQSDVLNSSTAANLSTADYESSKMNTGRIAGTATGNRSTYALARGSSQYGLLRNKTGYTAFSVFKNIWTGGDSSPVPYNENSNEEWQYRPEYLGADSTGENVYKFMYDDAGELLSVINKAREPLRQTGETPIGAFYNDEKTPILEVASPKTFQYNNPDLEYTAQEDLENRTRGNSGLVGLYSRMVSATNNNDETHPMFRKSTERYDTTNDGTVTNTNNYSAIPNGVPAGGTNEFVDKSSIDEGPFLRYLKEEAETINELKIDKRGFSRASEKMDEFGTIDTYNMMLPTKDENDMYLNGTIQSADIIFFYFHDLVNNVYIPFRATLAGIQDQSTPQWEDVKYMGRPDTLYIYKGYTRNVSFNFKVYANSIDEIIPMWKRVNYLVGLTRPSRYTEAATVTNEEDQVTTGRESGFMYPPMLTFRIGDLYVDQPGVLTSVAVSIPEEATWETLRDDDYTYVYGVEKTLTKTGSKTRQLPNMIDVSVQLNMIERKQISTNENHFGPLTGYDGWEMRLSDEQETAEQILEPVE